ncbi:hypothetical protein WP50_37255, partial [Lactiplantibacillus plantarum]
VATSTVNQPNAGSVTKLKKLRNGGITAIAKTTRIPNSNPRFSIGLRIMLGQLSGRRSLIA